MQILILISSLTHQLLQARATLRLFNKQNIVTNFLNNKKLQYPFTKAYIDSHKGLKIILTKLIKKKNLF